MLKAGLTRLKLPSGKSNKIVKSSCRAMVGIVAGGGRLDKPMLKAGNAYRKAFNHSPGSPSRKKGRTYCRSADGSAPRRSGQQDVNGHTKPIWTSQNHLHTQFSFSLLPLFLFLPWSNLFGCGL